jgi:AMP-polyphosphate phosphotransferase
MFEAAEVGRRVRKREYQERVPELHTRLLAAQRRLREADFPVIIIVSGVEGAGKGHVVGQINTWLDNRGIRTHAFWDATDEEAQRPWYWRFWRALPPKGTVGVLFGSWYTRPIVERALGDLPEADFEGEIARIARFERTLVDDGALIVKLWFHLSRQEQEKRLAADAEGKGRRAISRLTRAYARHYDDFRATSGRALRLTDTAHCPWFVIEAHDARYRDLTMGTILLESLERRLDEGPVATGSEAHHSPAPPDIPEATLTVLDRVTAPREVKTRTYRSGLTRLQRRLDALSWKTWKARRNVVAVFEGWDAAGKGGAIRRVTGGIDPRFYRVISIAAPTDEEHAYHYLWRFWRHLPRAGYMTLYDRSWYGRVLVERVEKLTPPEIWQRAYQEINEFEEQLVEHGTVLMKFWLHIDRAVQLQRFRERQRLPWKQHKITDEDWRNRERWKAYELAVNEMVARTSTTRAPWTLVAAHDKRHARLTVLRTFCERIEKAL